MAVFLQPQAALDLKSVGFRDFSQSRALPVVRFLAPHDVIFCTK